MIRFMGCKENSLDCVVRPYSSRSAYTPEATGTGFYFFNGTLIYVCVCVCFLSSAQDYTCFLEAEIIMNIFSHTVLEIGNF